jgi:glycosyltransferase involved in cell wall biosynthesis
LEERSLVFKIKLSLIKDLEQMTVTLFIPIKNEIEGLKVIMPRIKREWVDEILIIDGNSTDGSQDYLRKNGYDFTVQKSKGVRGAFWEAFELAKTDFIIPFSPDNNSVPEDIPLIIAKIKEGYDLVVASRYYKGLTSLDDDVMSRLANAIFTKLINFLFRSHYTDALTMYKAFKIKHLYELNLHKHKDEYAEVMITWRAARRKLKVTEVPSHEPKRLGAGGSRAHPGVFGKYKAALLLLKVILRDWLLFR